MTTFDGDGFRLRAWRAEDAESLARHGNNEKVSRGLRDRFPYPYSLADAERYLTIAPALPWVFAIEIDGAAAGGLGFHPGEDVHRVSAEVGYWLAEPYWGRGIVPAALRLVVPAAMDALELERVHAGVYSNNPSSMRVLEKAGFTREGVQRRAVIKRGEILDLVMYARLRAP